MPDLAASSPLTPVRIVSGVLRPFQQFAQAKSAGGIALLVCTALALGWANSPWSEQYFHLWETPVTIGAPGFGLTESLHHWINDGLMAVFFFLVGLEIKREILVGELASLRQAALPISAAIGGMVVPAALYALLNVGGPGAPGWGIPMATDIAFALGILALLGDRVPIGLKVYLAALAIVDDIGAVLVIALFYTASISWLALGIAAALLGLLMICNVGGLRHPAIYATIGVVVWLAFLESGIHATVSGVLIAMTIPSRTRIDQFEFVEQARGALGEFEAAAREGDEVLTSGVQQEAIAVLEDACEGAQAPLQAIEEKLHGVVAFGIMPLFALANAGVRIDGAMLSSPGPVTTGVALGLIVGKPLGITLASWLAVRAGMATMPGGVTWRLLHGASWLGGIGFTMSLFIASLAFGEGAAQLDAAKIGVLGASLLAGVVGFLVLRPALRARDEAR
jgi:NhaA family Na+:H+ antiporter